MWSIGQDVRFALRQIRRGPAFAASAVLTLALGVGANTGIFSLWNGFGRPLPVPDADGIVVIAATMLGDDTGFRYRFSYPALDDYRAETAVFSDVFGFDTRIAGLTARGKTTQLVYHAVTGNFFTGLRLAPLIGRGFEPGEGEHIGSEIVVVLGYQFWQRRFGGDPSVVFPRQGRRDLAGSMREVGRSFAGNSRQAIARKALVVAEVALCLMLLAGSSVLMRAFVAMQRVELGVPADRVLTMRVPLPAQRYPDAPRRIAFFQELLRRVSAVPGVAAAAVNSGLHPMGNMWTAAEITGEAPSQDPVQVQSVSADYTNVVGVRLAAGRLLTDADVNRSDPVALVNERGRRAS